jgi:RNA polymerase sigma-70 factor (ECF subfamily)
MDARAEVDVASIGALFDRCAPAVFGYLARRLGSQRAEDATAETFRIAVERFATFDPARGEPLPWLLGIATNVVRRSLRDEERWLRALARVPRPSLTDGRPADDGAGLPAGIEVGAALAALAPGDRDVIMLIAWEDLSYEQVAAALEVPVGTVRSRLHRARRQLREALAMESEVDLDG